MKQDDIKKFNAFDIKIEKAVNENNSKLIDSSQEDVIGAFKMREWQKAAFKKLKNAPYMILNAPMGSGKSSMMCYLAAFKMHQDPHRKCIISVPQEMIGPGFSVLKYPLFKMPDGTIIKWDIVNNLCLSGSHKRDRLIKWLQEATGPLSERTLLCTHAALVSMFKYLRSSGRLDLLANLLIWIDEAHHVMNAIAEDSDKIVSNGIGSLVHFILDTPNINIQLGLTTATLIRGDRYTILTPQMEEQFSTGRYDLSYDQYLGSCTHLKTFSYSFAVCGYDYISGIENIIRQKKGRDIIYIPPTNSRYSTDKEKETKRIIEKYSTLYGSNGQTIENNIIVLKNPGEDFKILDLVDDHYERRRSKKSYMNKLKQSPTDIHAIISMWMFKEGTDWECADRCIIVAPRSSLVEVIQMVGRVLRDFPGKEHVEIIHLLPLAGDHSQESLRETLNNVLKAVLCSMLLEDVLKPKQVNDTISKNRSEKEPLDKQPRSQPLMELIPNSEKRVAVLQDLSLRYLELREKYDDINISSSEMYNEFQRSVPKILEMHQVESNPGQISERAWSIVHRLCPSVLGKGLNVENIKFDAIESVSSIEGLLMYFGRACGLATFAELRRAIDISRVALTEEEIISWVEQYIAKHGKKPTQKSGVVEFAQGDHQGILWMDIDNSLKRGLRGLPGEDSLPALIKRRFGIKKREVSTLPIPIELARFWIRQYVDKHNKKPTKRNGVIEFAEEEYKGTTWGTLDSALRRGGRGLPKCSGLADLVEEERKIKNPKSVPVLSDEEILNHIQKFIKKHGRKPHCNDENVEGIDNLT